MPRRSLRHRAPVLWLLLPFMVGLIAARLLPRSLPPALLGAAAAAALGIALAAHRRPAVWGTAFCGGLFCAGLGHGQAALARIPEWDDLPPRQARVRLRIERRFSALAGSRTLSGLARVTAAPDTMPEIRGQRVYFSLAATAGAREPVRGEEFVGIGVLEAVPRGADAASFEGFLVNAGANFRFTRGRLLERLKEASPYQRFCDRARRRFSACLMRGLEQRPELAAISRGMLLGESGELSRAQHELFLKSGTLHLFSVSGLHIAAVAVALHFTFGLLRLPRWPRFAANLVSLWIYVEITGGSPSAVRAFWMVLLVEAAQTLRRPINPVAALALSAFLGLLANPLQLFGASFQLSYGIVSGLLLLGLPLAETWQERTALFVKQPKVTWAWWQRALSAAQRATTGALGVGVATALVSDLAGLLYFQLFTPGALLANLVLIPLASLALWSGFLSLLGGLACAPWLSVLFNHAAALVLLGIQEAIRILVAVPGTCIPGRFTDARAGFGAFAGLIVLFLFGYTSQWQLRRGGFWLPLGWTALSLAVAVRFT